MRVVVLLSGGLDSATLLARSIRHGDEPFCLAVDYGQRHRRELDAARAVAAHYARPLEVVAIPPATLAGSALTGTGDVPKGLHFADPGQAATVVPARNMLLATLGVAHAVRVGAKSVLLGSHKGDAAVYPDCREEFFRGLDAVSNAAYGVRVWAPFCTHDDKRDVAILARIMGVPIDLTWSCYEGGSAPCGGCGACVERLEALS